MRDSGSMPDDAGRDVSQENAAVRRVHIAAADIYLFGLDVQDDVADDRRFYSAASSLENAVRHAGYDNPLGLPLQLDGQGLPFGKSNSIAASSSSKPTRARPPSKATSI